MKIAHFTITNPFVEPSIECVVYEYINVNRDISVRVPVDVMVLTLNSLYPVVITYDTGSKMKCLGKCIVGQADGSVMNTKVCKLLIPAHLASPTIENAVDPR